MAENYSSDQRYAGRPSVCRTCGALIPAGEANCLQCGARVGAPVNSGNVRSAPGEAKKSDAAAVDHETVRFAQALFRRPATFTIVLLVANVALYLLTTFSGGGDPQPALLAYGAKYNYLIDNGEWWRFVTPVFLHGSTIHLFVNMYSLWMIGPYVERLYGSAKFVVFWVLCGIAGVVASYLSVRPDIEINSVNRFLFKPFDSGSVGASGALFGLIGVLFVFGIKYRHELPPGFKRAFGTGMLPTILINIFIGYAIPFIDNAAHMGGLAAGALLALVVNYKRVGGERGPVALVWHILQIAAIALVLVSFAFIWKNLPPEGVRPQAAANAPVELIPVNPSVQAYLSATNEGGQAFIEAMTKGNTGAVDEALGKLENAPKFDDEADAQRAELQSLLRRAQAFAATRVKERKTRRVLAEEKRLVEDFDGWQARRLQWFATNGKRYGIEIAATPAPADEQKR